MLQGLRRTAAIASSLLLALAACIVVALGAGTALGQLRLVPILSGSMSPEIEAGDAVVVRRVRLSSVRLGDVVTYHPPTGGKPVTHRVVDVVQAGRHPVVRTKGDANPVADPWTARLTGDGLWRVEARIPAIGHAMLAFDRPWGRTAAIWTLLGTALAAGLRLVWRRPPAVTDGLPRAPTRTAS